MFLKKSFVVTAFLVVFLTATGFQSSPEYAILFEKAKFTMETKGDMEGAIKLFNEIIEKYPGEREYAAKSQLYIGLCYEKLGLKEAQKAYRKVIDSYPEQTEAVRVANEKLSLLLRAEAVIRKEDKAFNIRKVWEYPEADYFGAPSPDGRYISYVDWETGDLAIYEIATGKKSRLTNEGTWDDPIEFADFSRWSPDGKQIVYGWYNENNFYELRIIGLDGSKPRILYRNEEVEWPHAYDWSPDGKQILAFFSKKDGPDQIVLVSAADGSVRVLKNINIILEQGWPQNMCFSPDGHCILYDYPQKEDSPDHDIFLLTSDGSREISLVEHPAHDFVLGWAPDGKNILFASDRTGNFDAFVIQVADGRPNGTPELIKKGIGQIWSMGFTRKGSFYFGQGTKSNDVYIAELDPETGKILVPPKKAIKRFEGSNNYPAYSPDGKYLAYISGRGRRKVLCIRSLETGEDRELFPKLESFVLPRWSPDCRSIVVWGSYMKKQGGLYQIDAQTGEVKPIGQQYMLVKYYAWTFDGKAIFYASKDTNNKLSRIIMRKLETGEEKDIYRQHSSPTYVRRLALSTDGSWLAFAESHKGLNVMPASGGEPRELCRFDEEEGIIHGARASLTWTADGKYILFAMENPKKDDPKWDLCRIPAEGGEIEKLGLEMIRISYLSVHPDGRHIAFSSPSPTIDMSDGVWVMENFLPE